VSERRVNEWAKLTLSCTNISNKCTMRNKDKGISVKHDCEHGCLPPSRGDTQRNCNPETTPPYAEE
jgi:hypothetical protein